MTTTTKKEAKQTGARMLTVRYEDFVETPNSVIGVILDFCRLSRSAGIEKKAGRYENPKNEPDRFSMHPTTTSHQRRVGVQSQLTQA